MGDYRDNIEIDLKDLMSKILTKWKLLVLCIIIGATLGGSYGFFHIDAQSQEAETDMAELEETLSDREIMETRSAVDTYLGYKKLYDEAKTYQDRSILMSIDTNQTPIARKMYLISDYEEEELNLTGVSIVDDIVALYQNMLYEDDVAGAVVASVEPVVNKEYAKELYSVSKTGKSMLVLQANGTNKQEAMSILETVAAKLTEKSASVSAHIPHKIEDVSTTYQSVYDDSVRAKKQSLISSLDSLNKSMASVSASLSAAQKSYFAAILDERGEHFGVERQQIVEDKLSSAGRYVVLGAFGLVFLAVVLIALRYIMTPVLKTEDDIRSAFGLPVIGSIKAGKNEDLSLLSYSIEARAKKEESDKICFIGAYEGTDAETKKSQLLQLMGEKDLSVTLGGNVLVDKDTVEKVTDSNAVVLFEKIGSSLYDDIAKEIELCKNYGIKILGTVVMK